MTYEIVEYYNGSRNVLDKTDCPHDAECIRRWHIDQWADTDAGAKATRVEPKKS